ncbi:MAG TPA: hypothetical protein VGB24_09595 [Longimicrobium sp.]|jgi:hypothetical protein|uniref:hypothetical protein n=1 Tax=Longimicrobium sp. TaxID=2029185 RepID=UPI002EDA1D6C
MKTLLLAALLSTAAAAPRPADAPAAPPDFTGAWTLDEAQSTGLPPYYAEIRSHRLAITQNDSQLHVGVEIENAEPEPLKMEFLYSLSGVETATQTPIRTPNGNMVVPTRLKATRGGDGRIHITITREIQMRDRTVTGVVNEVWEMRADGALVVHRVDQMPDGREMRADMVFVKS